MICVDFVGSLGALFVLLVLVLLGFRKRARHPVKYCLHDRP